MQKYAEYIEQIEIESLWSGMHHIIWNLDRRVNILSGVNGVGKSTILNKVVRGLSAGGEFPSHMLKGVHLRVFPEDAKWIRYDLIRSLDSPVLDLGTMAHVDSRIVSALDFQLYHLQRKYLDYQVNVGNRIIAILQSGEPDAAQKAQELSVPKRRFQDIVDNLFASTGKTILRAENEVAFMQNNETLAPYQLSSGEKQILAILLTVLVQDQQPYVLFMDEPEVSLHIEWQKQLIDLIVELNPNVQIILTTHSPALIMKGWIDHVTEVSDIIASALDLHTAKKPSRVISRVTIGKEAFAQKVPSEKAKEYSAIGQKLNKRYYAYKQEYPQWSDERVYAAVAYSYAVEREGLEITNIEQASTLRLRWDAFVERVRIYLLKRRYYKS